MGRERYISHFSQEPMDLYEGTRVTEAVPTGARNPEASNQRRLGHGNDTGVLRICSTQHAASYPSRH